MMLCEQFASLDIDCSVDPDLEYDLRHVQIEERPYGVRLVSDRSREKGHGDIVSALSIALDAARSLPIRSGGSWSPIKTTGLPKHGHGFAASGGRPPKLRMIGF